MGSRYLLSSASCTPLKVIPAATAPSTRARMMLKRARRIRVSPPSESAQGRHLFSIVFWVSLKTACENSRRAAGEIAPAGSAAPSFRTPASRRSAVGEVLGLGGAGGAFSRVAWGGGEDSKSSEMGRTG